jgi:hypothetical protein
MLRLDGSEGKDRAHTVHLLEHPLDGAGAAATGHGNVELVVVFRHLAQAM